MARLSDEILAACKAEPMLIHTQDAHRIVGTIEALESDLAEARQERNREADRRIEMNLDRAEMMLNLAEAQAALAALVEAAVEQYGQYGHPEQKECLLCGAVWVASEDSAHKEDCPLSDLTALAKSHDLAIQEAAYAHWCNVLGLPENSLPEDAVAAVREQGRQEGLEEAAKMAERGFVDGAEQPHPETRRVVAERIRALAAGTEEVSNG